MESYRIKYPAVLRICPKLTSYFLRISDKLMSGNTISWDLICDIVRYIPLGDLRDLERVHAIFTREICRTGLRVFYNDSGSGNKIINLLNKGIVVIELETGEKEVLIRTMLCYKSLMGKVYASMGDITIGSLYDIARDIRYFVDIVNKVLIYRLGNNFMFINYGERSINELEKMGVNISRYVKDDVGITGLKIDSRSIDMASLLLVEETRGHVIKKYSFRILWKDNEWGP